MIVSGDCVFGNIPLFTAHKVGHGKNDDSFFLMVTGSLQKAWVYNQSIVIFYRPEILDFIFFEKVSKKIHTYILPQYLAFYNTALDKISKKLYPYYN